MVEAWLRGPIEGVPALLMPAAHSLTDALEELEGASEGLTVQQLWMRPAGAASVGFHLRHVARSTDRLLTYARGEQLSREQLEALRTEGDPGDPPPEVEALLGEARSAIGTALNVYRSTDTERLLEPRAVGRARLPSTVHGLLFHVAEHARRHAGQVITTARIVRGLEE